MTAGKLRQQAAHMMENMRGFRYRLFEAKRLQRAHPECMNETARRFGMDPAGRRQAFDTWHALHKLVVTRLPRLP